MTYPERRTRTAISNTVSRTLGCFMEKPNILSSEHESANTAYGLSRLHQASDAVGTISMKAFRWIESYSVLIFDATTP